MKHLGRKLGTNYLVVKNLSVKVKEKDILSQISFNLAKGGTLSLIGESGGGKTILINALMGILPRPEYNIEKEILSFWGSPKLEKGLNKSIIFQDALSYLNPVRKIGTQIDELFHAHKKRVDHQKIWNYFDEFKIKDPKEKLNSYPHQISGGEAQRILILMAFLLEPKIVFADEPMASLDFDNKKIVLDFFKAWQEKKLGTLVISSHDLNFIQEFSNKDHQVLVLKNGTIEEQGNSQIIFNNPKKSYTKKLLNLMERL